MAKYQTPAGEGRRRGRGGTRVKSEETVGRGGGEGHGGHPGLRRAAARQRGCTRWGVHARRQGYWASMTLGSRGRMSRGMGGVMVGAGHGAVAGCGWQPPAGRCGNVREEGEGAAAHAPGMLGAERSSKVIRPRGNSHCSHPPQRPASLPQGICPCSPTPTHLPPAPDIHPPSPQAWTSTRWALRPTSASRPTP